MENHVALDRSLRDACTVSFLSKERGSGYFLELNTQTDSHQTLRCWAGLNLLSTEQARQHMLACVPARHS